MRILENTKILLDLHYFEMAPLFALYKKEIFFFVISLARGETN